MFQLVLLTNACCVVVFIQSWNPYHVIELAPAYVGAFFVAPNDLRGSHCGAAALEALSCGRDRVRWPVPLAFYPREAGGRVGRVQPAAMRGQHALRARPARSYCAAWIAGGTRGALCGPRSTILRAAASRSGGAFLWSALIVRI